MKTTKQRIRSTTSNRNESNKQIRRTQTHTHTHTPASHMNGTTYTSQGASAPPSTCAPANNQLLASSSSGDRFVHGRNMWPSADHTRTCRFRACWSLVQCGCFVSSYVGSMATTSRCPGANSGLQSPLHMYTGYACAAAELLLKKVNGVSSTQWSAANNSLENQAHVMNEMGCESTLEDKTVHSIPTACP